MFGMEVVPLTPPSISHPNTLRSSEIPTQVLEFSLIAKQNPGNVFRVGFVSGIWILHPPFFPFSLHSESEECGRSLLSEADKAVMYF